MTIPPLAPEAEASRKYFVALRELRDQFAAEFQIFRCRSFRWE